MNSHSVIAFCHGTRTGRIAFVYGSCPSPSFSQGIRASFSVSARPEQENSKAGGKGQGSTVYSHAAQSLSDRGRSGTAAEGREALVGSGIDIGGDPGCSRRQGRYVEDRIRDRFRFRNPASNNPALPQELSGCRIANAGHVEPFADRSASGGQPRHWDSPVFGGAWRIDKYPALSGTPGFGDAPIDSL